MTKENPLCEMSLPWTLLILKRKIWETLFTCYIWKKKSSVFLCLFFFALFFFFEAANLKFMYVKKGGREKNEKRILLPLSIDIYTSGKWVKWKWELWSVRSKQKTKTGERKTSKLYTKMWARKMFAWIWIVLCTNGKQNKELKPNKKIHTEANI